MKKKNSLILDDEFIQYCELNNIVDIEKLARETFNRGFTILKYGEQPSIKLVEVVKQATNSFPLNVVDKKIPQPLIDEMNETIKKENEIITKQFHGGKTSSDLYSE